MVHLKRLLVPYMYKASWIMLVLFIILAVLDFVSTFSIGELAHYLEANPVYMLGWGFAPIIMLNVLFIYLTLWLYDNFYAVHRRYLILSTFVWFSLLRVIVIYNNFGVAKDVKAGVITKEIAMSVTTAAKNNYYLMSFVVILIMPVLITWLIYGIYVLDHEVASK